MSRKVRILLVEDEFWWRQKLKQKLDSILGGGRYELVECINQTSAFEAINHNQVFDVALIDSKLPEGDIAGELILTAAWKKCARTRLFLVSQYFGLPNVLRITTGLPKNHPGIAVTPIAKAGLVDPNDNNFEEDLKKELAHWMIEMSHYIAASESERIRNSLLQEKPISGDETVFILGEIWPLQNLFLFYWNNPAKVSEIIRCLTRNLSLAFSECFGILGIKQLTHNASNYYATDNLVLDAKIKEQFHKLDQVLDELKVVTANVYNLMEDDINKYNEFKSAYLASNASFDGTLQSLRNKYFQFKGSGIIKAFDEILRNQQSQGHLTEFHLQELNLADCDSKDEFELNLPIHRILQSRFEGLFKRIFPNASNKGACASKCEIFTCAVQTDSRAIDNYNIRLCENLLVMRHGGDKILHPLAWLERSQEPDWLQHLQELIPFFGRFYLLTRKTLADDFEVFDCTYFPIHSIGKFQAWDSKLRVGTLECTLKRDAANTTYYIFSFSAWRQ